MPEWPDWRGKPVAIIASGPSTKKAGLEHLKGRIVTFTIKKNIELTPWADAVYGCDFPWWRSVRGLPDFKGFRLSYHDRSVADFGCLKVEIPDVKSDKLLFETVGTVGAGGNSGFQAVNLALQFGASKLLLVGFDYGGEHWYGRNNWHGGGNPSETNFTRWRAALNAAEPVIRERGVEVVNASRDSTVKAFRKQPIAETLEEWGL